MTEPAIIRGDDEKWLDDEHYLHALREAASDWGIEPLDEEPVVARRAAIWFGRNMVALIDEVRRLRARVGEGG